MYYCNQQAQVGRDAKTTASPSLRCDVCPALLCCCWQATDAADKDRALRALARVTTKSLISRTLDYALSPAVRTQDVSVLLVRLAKQGGLAFSMTWQFIIDRADDILKKYGGEGACGRR